jgi:hypothetical protein
MALHPTPELVAKAWILGISGVPSGKVATSLPEDRSTWPAGFVVAMSLGGEPELHVKKRRSVLDITCWYPAKEGSNRPAWNKAAQLAETVFDAGYDAALTVQRLLQTLPTLYNDARVLSFMPQEPEKRGADEDGNAAFGFEAEMHWIEVPE